MNEQDVKIGMPIFTSQCPFTLYTVKDYPKRKGLNSDEIILTDGGLKDKVVCLGEIFQSQSKAISKRLEFLESDNRMMDCQIVLNNQEIKAINACQRYFR
jgi:hypothetical protein